MCGRKWDYWRTQNEEWVGGGWPVGWETRILVSGRLKLVGGREKDISGSYHSQSFNNNRVLYVSYYCTTTTLDFDGLNDIHDSFSNTSSPQ